MEQLTGQHPVSKDFSYVSPPHTGDHLAHILRFANKSQLQSPGHYNVLFLLDYTKIKGAIVEEAYRILDKIVWPLIQAKTWELEEARQASVVKTLEEDLSSRGAGWAQAESDLRTKSKIYDADIAVIMNGWRARLSLIKTLFRLSDEEDGEIVSAFLFTSVLGMSPSPSERSFDSNWKRVEEYDRYHPSLHRSLEWYHGRSIQFSWTPCAHVGKFKH